jgi:hypothetical protein
MSGVGNDSAAASQPAGELEQVGTLTRLSDGKEFALGFGSLRVGRQRRADLVVTDKTVSRHHADVCYESGRYVLYDHSTNGTWINNILVAVAQPLRAGDTVKFGKAEFRFSLKAVPKHEAAKGEITAPKRVPGSSTIIMRGGKGSAGKRVGQLIWRPARVLLYVVFVLAVAFAVLYYAFPDVADQLIQSLPPSLQGILSRN